jgi:hypothetical protein
VVDHSSISKWPWLDRDSASGPTANFSRDSPWDATTHVGAKKRHVGDALPPLDNLPRKPKGRLSLRWILDRGRVPLLWRTEGYQGYLFLGFPTSKESSKAKGIDCRWW